MATARARGCQVDFLRKPRTVSEVSRWRHRQTEKMMLKMMMKKPGTSSANPTRALIKRKGEKGAHRRKMETKKSAYQKGEPPMPSCQRTENEIQGIIASVRCCERILVTEK